MSTNKDHIEQYILDAIRDIKYGEVAIHIHDSRIVQVEKTQKTRFTPSNN